MDYMNWSFLQPGLFALVFGEVLFALEASTASRDEYAARMRSINETMAYKRVPANLQRRVHRFYEFMWLVHGAAMNNSNHENPMEWLGELPSALRVDINAAQYKTILLGCPLFADHLKPELLTVIAQHLKPIIYMPDELLVKEGGARRAQFGSRNSARNSAQFSDGHPPPYRCRQGARAAVQAAPRRAAAAVGAAHV